MNQSVQYGIIATVLAIIVNMLFYFVKPMALFSYVPWLVFIIVLIVMILSARFAKEKNGGFLDLKDALKAAWLPAIIAIACLGLFKYVLFNFIDPELIELQIKAAIQQANKFTDLMGAEMDEDMFEDMEDSIRNNSSMTLPKVFLGILITWIVHFIPAIIIAAIIKKNPIVEIDTQV